VALAVACSGGGTGPGGGGVPRSGLLALGRSAAAEPNPATCSFKNNVLSTCQITHSDSVHTLFATISFSPHSIVSRNDTLLCDTCTIFITLTTTPGSYELTLGPATLVFNASAEPVATVSFGTYGDASVYTQSPRYASASEFVQALALWFERSPDRWVIGRNSAFTGPTTITSAVEGPGAMLLAAPK
jgi:hypothetical protein